MQEVTRTSVVFPSTGRDALMAILRQGAQQMFSTAIEAEVAEWIDSHRQLADERGHRQMVRNGYLPEREIITGLGPFPTTRTQRFSRPQVGQRVVADEPGIENAAAEFRKGTAMR